MDQGIASGRGETAAHNRLKRLALLWAQTQGYSLCGVEVTLLGSRYRVDVAACRPTRNGISSTAIFECKQARGDLRRNSCCTPSARQRFDTLHRRRQIIEAHLRVHYPRLRKGEYLFAEFDAYDFGAIGHRNYSRIIRELTALQNQLSNGTKFEKLARYHTANLLFLVLPNELFNPREIPAGWGVLLESDGALSLAQKPRWHETTAENQIRLLHRIALAGTRQLNKQFKISFDEISVKRCSEPSMLFR